MSGETDASTARVDPIETSVARFSRIDAQLHVTDHRGVFGVRVCPKTDHAAHGRTGSFAPGSPSLNKPIRGFAHRDPTTSPREEAPHISAPK